MNEIKTKMERERRWTVKLAKHPSVEYVDLYIEQLYIYGEDDKFDRLRRSRLSYGNQWVYVWNNKKNVSLGEKLESECQITKEEFDELAFKQVEGSTIVKKMRRIFSYDGWRWELDYFLEPRFGLIILEVELPSLNVAIELPPWIEVEKEITGDELYSNFSISSCRSTNY